MTSLKQREERKRERAWTAAARWRVIQDTITWAEAQASVPRNEPASRLAEEASKLGKTVKR